MNLLIKIVVSSYWTLYYNGITDPMFSCLSCQFIRIGKKWNYTINGVITLTTDLKSNEFNQIHNFSTTWLNNYLTNKHY